MDVLTIVEGLNEAQYEAVTISRALLIMAGAGSENKGFTHRIAYLLKQGRSHSGRYWLLPLNKAANEMKERLAKLVGPAAIDMWVSTSIRPVCVF